MNKKVILSASYHHHNTINLVKNTFDEASSDWFNLLKDDISELNLLKYEEVVICSGIYFQKLHKKVLEYVSNNRDVLASKKVFIIITAGTTPKYHLRKSEKYLKSLGIKDVKLFSCLGFDTYGPLKLVGGKNRNRPNELDLFDLQQFMKEHHLT